MYLWALLGFFVGYPAGCPDDGVVYKLLARGSVYVGEIHGTNESPEFVACLVAKAVEKGEVPHVSLEVPVEAVNPEDPFWMGEDGRSSIAMRRLLNYVVALEVKGYAKLSYQNSIDGCGNFNDRCVGEYLRVLSLNSVVIALSGNVHASRSVSVSGIAPAGSYIGERFVNVRLASSNGGRAWLCTDADCSVITLKGSSSGMVPGSLIEGGDYGYDYIYYLDRYTPSMPLSRK